MSLSTATLARALPTLHHARPVLSALACPRISTSLCISESHALKKTQFLALSRGLRTLSCSKSPSTTLHNISPPHPPYKTAFSPAQLPRQSTASLVTDVPKYYGPCPFKCLNRDTGLGPSTTSFLHGRHVRWKSTDEDAKDIATKAPESEQADLRAAAALPKDTKPVDTRPLYERLPEAASNVAHRFHRPTKEELLAAASGFWARMRVRFKWHTIRSVRPFNADEIGAFFSWIVLGHVVWIILGTTTFVSLLILAVNTVFAQETLARWIGNYLTKSVGVKVVFESAIVPKWRDGVITFKNVFVSRRPGLKDTQVSKGSSTSAAAAAAEMANERRASTNEPEEDTNYTQYDLSIETINVTLSFSKWFNGKGLLRDVEMKGVRGVVDRTHVHWGSEYVDPRTYKHEHQAGDFEIESFKLEDLLVSVYQPSNFRPYSVSIFTADLPQLRKQWLFYDLLSANHVSGSFDDSLFTIHPRQIHNLTGAQLSETASEQEHRHWKKHSRIRMDGLKIDHLNRGVEGPLGWIHEGNVDIVADIAFPAEDDDTIVKVMSDFYEKMEQSLTTNRYLHTLTNPNAGLSTPSINSDVINNDSSENTTSLHPATANPTINDPSPSSSSSSSSTTTDKDNRFIILDLRIHLNAVHASIPLFTDSLSYVSNALIRPIVAYINNNKDFIPVTCRVVKRLSEFDGSWTVYDSGLMEDMSRETYEAFARDVVDDGARGRRLRKVGMWSLQLVAQALFLGLAGHLA